MHQISSLGNISFSAKLSGARLKEFCCTVLEFFLKRLKKTFKNSGYTIYGLRYDPWISKILKQEY